MNGSNIAGHVISVIGIVLLLISAVYNYWYTPTGTIFVIIGSIFLFVGMCIRISTKKEKN